MTKLTALLIVYNEIDHLPAVIDSVGFADEIIAVDSFSTDGTYEALSKDPRVRVVQRPFDQYAAQRTYAISLAQHDWILFIDADERVSVPLQKEIKTTLASSQPKAAYYFYRQFYFKEKPLRFSGLQTDKVYRLFNKNIARYIPHKIVHETLEVAGESGLLKNKLDHYFYHDYDDYRNRMVAYGKLKGKELFDQEKSFSLLKLWFKPLYKFITHYIIRLGILDGHKGWIISKLNALSVKVRYKELRRLQSLSPE
ncbi:MAG: glycosyltransferase family 2 protein [Gilvibacter sp.]